MNPGMLLSMDTNRRGPNSSPPCRKFPCTTMATLLFLSILLQGKTIYQMPMSSRPWTELFLWSEEWQPPANDLEKEQSWNYQRFEHRDNKTLLDFLDAEPETSCPVGLSMARDTRLLDEITPPTSSIPKVIHLTSKSRCLTKDFLDNLDRWRFPGYSVLIHNDAAVDALLQRFWPEFPELSKAAHCLKSGAGKADLWRALVLWEFGGIYADIDSAPNVLFGKGTAIADSDESFFVVETEGWLSQYFMAAKPHHPLFYLLIHKIIQRLYSLNDVDRQYVPRSTGPGALKFAFIAFMNDQGGNFYEGFGDCNRRRAFRYGKVTAGKYTGWDNRTVTVVGDKSMSNEYVQREKVKKKKDPTIA